MGIVDVVVSIFVVRKLYDDDDDDDESVSVSVSSSTIGVR